MSERFSMLQPVPKTLWSCSPSSASSSNIFGSMVVSVTALDGSFCHIAELGVSYQFQLVVQKLCHFAVSGQLYVILVKGGLAVTGIHLVESCQVLLREEICHHPPRIPRFRLMVGVIRLVNVTQLVQHLLDIFQQIVHLVQIQDLGKYLYTHFVDFLFCVFICLF